MEGKMEFIIGRAGSGKTRACLSGIRQRISQAPLGPACVLLLPEHMTYRIERELAAAIPAGGFFRAYVFGFRRFARQILLETGGLLRPRITEIGRRLLLKKILYAHSQAGDLRFFARAAKQRGFSLSLSDAIQEIKSYAFTPELLQETAARLPEGALQDKLTDLSHLVGDFEQAMAGRYDDAQDLMNLLIERIPSSRLLEGAEVFIDGFLFFNPQEKAVIRALLACGLSLHVTLTMDTPLEASENLRETGLFHRSFQTFRQLRDLASELGASVSVRPLKSEADDSRFGTPALRLLEQRLFSSPMLSAAETRGDGVQIVEAANRRIEVEAAAADILRLTREKGWRFRDIGILVRDAESYENLLPLVLEDRQIPFFEDGRRRTVHHPLAELVRSSLETVRRGWSYEPVIRCLRTGFFPLTVEQIDRLENYVLEFGIHGRKRWTMEEPWPWHRRISLDDDEEELSEERRQELAEIDMYRRAAAPLAQLEEELRQGKTVKAYTQALYAYLEALRVPDTLSDWSGQSEREAQLSQASVHRQVWEDVLELLDQIMETGGSEELSLSEYEIMVDEGLDALSMKIIPPGLDAVTVAPFDQNSLAGVKAVYILGANEGVMPQRTSEHGLFSDADRTHLREALQGTDLEVAFSSYDASLAEKFLLYRGFTEASAYLWVSYTLADEEGKGQAPSSCVTSLRRLLPQAGFLSLPLETMEARDDMESSSLSCTEVLRLADARKSVTGLASALRLWREHRQMSGLWQDVYNFDRQQEELKEPMQAAIRGLFAGSLPASLPEEQALRLFTSHRRLRGSVTRFETFRKCPFQHFARYGLKLEERKEQRLQSLDIGNLLHGCMREFGEQLKKEGRRWKDVSQEEVKEMTDCILKSLAPRIQNEILLSTKAYEHLLQRIGLTARRSFSRLIAMDTVSSFHPELFERSFGRKRGDLPPLMYNLSHGVVLEITGQIDRIDFDESGRYFTIIDYKTGEAALNLIDVYYGIRLQLLTYLLVARNLLETRQEKRLPAGVLYCFLKNPLGKEPKRQDAETVRKHFLSKLKMPGWVLADPEVIRAADPAGEFIKVSLKKDGSLYQNSMEMVKTEQEFSALLDYVGLLLRQTGESILRGDVAASPVSEGMGTACQYCLFRSLCGFDPMLGSQFRTLEKKDDTEIMKEIRNAIRERGGTQDA
jgi:ATP-dependent helicase/nuclease subunit B